MYLLSQGSVCPIYTDPMHIFSYFFEKQLGLPRDSICRRINHALVGYSIPVTHRWLQVDLPTIPQPRRLHDWLCCLSEFSSVIFGAPNKQQQWELLIYLFIEGL